MSARRLDYTLLAPAAGVLIAVVLIATVGGTLPAESAETSPSPVPVGPGIAGDPAVGSTGGETSTGFERAGVAGDVGPQHPGSTTAGGTGVGEASSAPPRGRVIAERTLLTGGRIAIVESASGNRSIAVTGGGPVHVVTMPDGGYAIPGGVDHERFDRSLFALDVLFPEERLPDGDPSDDERGAQSRDDERGAQPRESRRGTHSREVLTDGVSPTADVAGWSPDPNVQVLLHTNATPEVVEAAGFDSATALPSAGIIAAQYDATSAGAPIETLEQRATVERVTLDRRVSLASGQPSVESAFDPDVNATGEDVTIAVLDTGIDAMHPDLADRVVHRHEIVESGDELDPSGHGTAVAGIIAGTGNASRRDRSGLAPEAKLVDVRVADENASGTLSELMAGIEYAVEETDADVLTMSLGTTDRDRELAKTIDWAIEHGVVVVTAGGNDGSYRSIDQTGAREDVLTVGATGRDLSTVAPFSSHGPTGDGRVKPDLVAPGVGLPTVDAGTGDTVDAYTRFTGTSAAAPYAAGAVALLLDRDPTLTVEEVHSRLGSTATPLPNANAFEQGSGRIDVEDALDPAVLADEPTVSPGVLEPNGTEQRRVTFENVDDRTHRFTIEPELTRVETGADATDQLSVNRSRITLTPGESATVEITVDAPEESGLYAGALEYAVDGESRSVALGFVRGGIVTVEKRTLTRGEDVDGTTLLLFSEDLTHTDSVTFENGTATFVSGGGTYYFLAGRTDRATGTTVLVYEKRRLEGSERIVLDERETVPAELQLGPIADEYGPLANVTVTASLTAPVGGSPARWDTAGENAETRSVRVSAAPGVEFARTALLVPERQHGERPLDVRDVFHLAYGTVGTEELDDVRPRVTLPQLATAEYRYYRTERDERYAVVPEATVVDVRNHQPPYEFELGDRHRQRIHRLVEQARYRYTFTGPDWRAVATPDDERSWTFAAGPGVQSTRSIREQPLVAAVTPRERTDRKLTVDGAPFSGTGALSVRRSTARTNLSMRVNGQQVNETTRSSAELRTSAVVDRGDNVTISLAGRAPDATLSTNTTTTVSIRNYDPDGPGPPVITGLDFVDATAGNAIRDTAELRIRGTAFERTPTTRVWYAAGAPEAPPWKEDDAWIPASTERSGENVLATLDLTDPRLDFAEHEPTISVATSFESWDGHRVRTTTTNAAHVGTTPDFSTAELVARVLDHEGEPATGDVVLLYDEQRDEIRSWSRVGVDGRVSFTVPKNRSYKLGHHQSELFSGEYDSLDASRPMITAIDRVTVADHRDLGTYRLPAANETSVTVFDQRGQPVPNATVSFVHRAGNANVETTLQANENGTVDPGGPDGPGLPLAGEVEIVATPPGDEATPALSGESGTRTLRIDTDTIATVVVPNRTPEANLTASTDVLTHGEPVVLNAARSDGPAPITSYEWNLTGLGAGTRTTDGPLVGVTPNATTAGPVEVTVTAVDELGHRDTERLLLRAEQGG